MICIYKYALGHDRSSHYIPKNGKILTVQEQNGSPKLWVLVNTEEPLKLRHFVSFYTGEQIAEQPGSIDHLEYIGTFQIDGGNLVYHLFENKS